MSKFDIGNNWKIGIIESAFLLFFIVGMLFCRKSFPLIYSVFSMWRSIMSDVFKANLDDFSLGAERISSHHSNCLTAEIVFTMEC